MTLLKPYYTPEAAQQFFTEIQSAIHYFVDSSKYSRSDEDEIFLTEALRPYDPRTKSPEMKEATRK